MATEYIEPAEINTLFELVTRAALKGETLTPRIESSYADNLWLVIDSSDGQYWFALGDGSLMQVL